MESEIAAALEELRVLHDTLQRVRVDRRLKIRAHSDDRLREATLRDQRDRLILELIEHPFYHLTQAELARGLRLSRERIRQVVGRLRRRRARERRTRGGIADENGS